MPGAAIVLAVLAVVAPRTELERQRHAFEVELRAQRIFDEALVRRGHEIGVVDVEHEQRRVRLLVSDTYSILSGLPE